jgi:cell division protein ZipA
MDKELVRIIIIATGLIVIISMLIWGYIRNRRLNQDMSFLDDIPGNAKGNSSPSFNPKGYTDEELDFDLDVVPLNSVKLNKQIPEHDYIDDDAAYELPKAPINTSKSIYPQGFKSANSPVALKTDSKEHLPKILQFSIVSTSDQGFNGVALADVFDMVGLEYGSMKIFERLDLNRLVDFGVASMVNPGTFPGTREELHEFFTPGITFFMQPRELPDPLLVFDDLMRTINLIAKELDGQKWDSERKPLSEFTIKVVRKSLQVG